MNETYAVAAPGQGMKDAPARTTVANTLDAAISAINEAHMCLSNIEDSMNPQPRPEVSCEPPYPCGIENQSGYLNHSLESLNTRLRELRARLS